MRDAESRGGDATGEPPAETTGAPPAGATPPETGADDGGTAPSADTGAASGDGASLNEEGFALIREGDYADAVPILQDAAAALEGSGDELTYNYALYNLGVAYLGAGRPADAIPVLEQRMRFDDGQLDEVRAKLSQAYADAGEAPPDDKPGNGPKPGHAVPPPFEETDD